VHALTLSAHKIGGPKGAAALVLDKRVELEPLIAGGGHERGLRSGTENVAAIVGFGVACELAVQSAGRRWRSVCSKLRGGSKRASSASVRRSLARLPNACRTPFISRSLNSMAKRWSDTWTVPATRWPAAPPVRVPTRSPRMCCGRWGSIPNWHAARCVSASGRQHSKNRSPAF
jgi:hypothetical protein